MSRRAVPQAALVNGALILLAVFALAPLAWMVSVSLMPAGSADAFPPPLVPARPTLAAYKALFAHHAMGRYLANSLQVAGGITLLSLACNTAAGYAFAKLRFAGREALFRALLASLLVPGQVILVPLFLLIKPMGLVDSLGGVIAPAAASVFGIFLVRQYAVAIPDELLEAARVDGASEGRLFAAIVLPALAPVMATLAIFTFLAAWNDFLWPLIVLSEDRLYTLPVALAALQREHGGDTELMMAGAVITIAPVLLLFLVLQRAYMRGILAGAVKG